MLNAILNSKSGRLNAADEQSIRWRDLFRGSEDLVTSTIFERLSYLPALTAWSLLAVAAGGQLTAYRMADLAEMEFWPFWDADDRVRGVEPDVFIRIELGDPGRSVQIIAEAKHDGDQSAGQLRVELHAWYQAVSSGVIDLPDQLIVMAIGGLPAPHRRQQFKSELAAAVEAIEGLVADVDLVLVDWADLARAIALHLPGSGHEERIIKDMRKALDLYGYHHIVEPLQLERLIAQRPINPGLTHILMKMNKTAMEAQKA